MKTLSKTTFGNKLRSSALALATIALAGGSAFAGSSDSAIKLLTAKFDARQVVQVEAGDFHFKPGQNAPVHTHTAPAVGYVAKGTIIYQVEGEKVQILREGDAFYEPTDVRVLRFDNASATEEAIFVDFNLEQAGEPFIVFEKQPTEAIDRRTLPTTKLDGSNIDQVDIYANELAHSATLKINNSQPTLGLVAEGVIQLQIEGEKSQRLVAGETFAIREVNSTAILVNASTEVSAKVITFRLNDQHNPS